MTYFYLVKQRKFRNLTPLQEIQNNAGVTLQIFKNLTDIVEEIRKQNKYFDPSECKIWKYKNRWNFYDWNGTDKMLIYTRPIELIDEYVDEYNFLSCISESQPIEFVVFGNYELFLAKIERHQRENKNFRYYIEHSDRNKFILLINTEENKDKPTKKIKLFTN